MSLRFKTNLLEHAKAVGAWAAARGARTSIDAVDMTLRVEHAARTFTLWPQFVGKRDGRQLSYFAAPDRFAHGFVGWLPHPPLAWDISLDKLAFKAAAQVLDIDTPAHWREPQQVSAPFLVKRQRGAFGHGLQGPFMTADAAALTLADGEFCEAFTWGRIARAWYWNARLVVLELFAMPCVTGDGVSRYDALLRRASADVPDDFAPLARLQGVAPGDVPAAGQRIVCDYRYVSPFNPTVYANANVLLRLHGSALVQRFASAGQKLATRIPAPADGRFGFVLDAIVDAHDRPWFLEINSNPQGHPDVYAAMLDGLCNGLCDLP